VAAVCLARQQGRLIQRRAAIGFLFDCNNLDFVALHLRDLADLLSDQMMGKRRHIGDRSDARIRLVFADDPERLATAIVAQNGDPRAERDRCRARGLRLQNRTGDAFREIARIPRGQFQSATARGGVLYRLRPF
jgi:hypothetical protein